MPATNSSLTIVRQFKASPAKVYGALTDPAQIVHWWSPDAGPTLRAEADVRPGGAFSVTFKTRNGDELNVRGVYLEVIPNKKLVFTWVWATLPEHQSVVTVSLKAIERGTELTLSHEQFRDEEERDSHRQGWGAALEKLDALLVSIANRPGDRL